MAANASHGTDDAPDPLAYQTNGLTTVANGQNKANDEESPLLPHSDSPDVKKSALGGVGTIIAILLLGTLNLVSAFVDAKLSWQQHRRIRFKCRCHSGHGRRRPYLLRV